MTARCRHVPTPLYVTPHPADVPARLFHWDREPWVVCSTCGATGYWGGHGHNRRIRWNYGGPDLKDRAAQWNAWAEARRMRIEATGTADGDAAAPSGEG